MRRGSADSRVLLVALVAGLVALLLVGTSLRPEPTAAGAFVDTDGDGVADEFDNCPGDPNPNQEDSEGDGIGDACDPDSDNDGYPVPADCNDHAANIHPGAIDYPFTTDDEDCDGHLAGDTDDDGVIDLYDNCVAVPNPDQTDFEGDLIGDACDPDKDGDGWSPPDDCNDFSQEISPDDTELANNGIDEDCDGFDLTGPDADGDGILDVTDNCPDVSNVLQFDYDEDGLGDACDPDDDNDSVADDSDNCPQVPNPDQADYDGDGFGDQGTCDIDDDADTVLDPFDLCDPDGPNPPAKEDLDGDRDDDGCPEKPVDKCLGFVPTIIGTDGSDYLVGTPGRDVITGLGSGDLIVGAGGDDIICGDDGVDLIFAGAGVDFVHGGNGSDYVVGQGGNDFIAGGNGADWVDGADGKDWLAGGNGNDVLTGDADNDIVNGEAGSDTCDGGFGTDNALNCELTANIP